MNDDELAAIEARLDNVTFSPWKVTHYAGGLSFNGPPSVCSSITLSDGYPLKIAECNHNEDADFIARAPTDIAALLAEVKRLRARGAELEAALRALLSDDYPETYCTWDGEWERHACDYCGGKWKFDESERHDYDCPVLQARAALAPTEKP